MNHPKPPHMKSKATTASPELPDPSKRERAAITAACEKLARRPRPPRTAVQTSPDGQLRTGASYRDEGGWVLHLTEALGSSSPEFALEQLNLLMRTAKTDLSSEERTTAVNAMLAAVAGVQPQNETKGALAVQMAATHQLAMMFLGRAKLAQHIPLLETNGNLAVKLLRTYTAQVETLAKLRRGGNQTVRVEHVHVHSGGQAIVGAVTHPGEAGGANKGEDHPMHPSQKQPSRDVSRLNLSPRCGAKTRNGSAYRSPAVTGRTRCRMHGGARNSGAPKGEANGNYQHGNFTCETIHERRIIRDLIRQEKGALSRLE